MPESQEAEIIGTTDRPGARRARLDPDPGLAGVDFQPAHRAAFKVPTLRNIALTAPYMHNGAFATLDQVVEFYDRGRAVGGGLELPTQTLPADSLHLSGSDKVALVAFLRSLTDTAAASLPSPITGCMVDSVSPTDPAPNELPCPRRSVTPLIAP